MKLGQNIRLESSKIGPYEVYSFEFMNQDNKKSCAVLLAIAADEGEPIVILTKRTDHLTHYAGQICLPGGMMERGESIEQAAIREFQEEISITNPINRIGYLREQRTSSGLIIYPVYGFLQGSYVLHPNPSEVSEVIKLPLRMVLYPDRFMKNTYFHTKKHHECLLYNDHLIWGVTATMLKSLGNVLV